MYTHQQVRSVLNELLALVLEMRAIANRIRKLERAYGK